MLVPLEMEWIKRYIVFSNVGPDLLLGPRDQRIHLHQVKSLIVAQDGCMQPGGALYVG